MTEMTGTQAAQEWLASIPFPPPYENGKVSYPEGEVTMGVTEYVTLHGMCSHDAQMRAVQWRVLNDYLGCKGFLGLGRKVLLGELLHDLAVITGHTEYEDVQWGK